MAPGAGKPAGSVEGEFRALASEPVLLSLRLVCQVRESGVWVAVSDTTDTSTRLHPQRSQRWERPDGATLHRCVEVAAWYLPRAYSEIQAPN